ncbi:MAG: TrmH family RNA methyltransferase [Spirochaetota bacterium]
MAKLSKTFTITSFSNDKVKYVHKLREKRNRDREGKFLIEGFRELTRALQSKKITFQSLFVAPDCFLGKNEERLVEKLNTTTFTLPRKLFEKISYRDRPDGLLAVCQTPDFHLKEDTQLSGDFFLIIEGVEKPGNLGTILRTAEGAGVSAIFVTDPRIDLFNPNVIRSSTGTLFTSTVYKSTTEQVLGFLQNQGVVIFAVTPKAEQYYFQQSYQERFALMFGSEQYGLSEYARNTITTGVSLPMLGEADSLNLAMSCGILIYEVVRQRMQK